MFRQRLVRGLRKPLTRYTKTKVVERSKVKTAMMKTQVSMNDRYLSSATSAAIYSLV